MTVSSTARSGVLRLGQDVQLVGAPEDPTAAVLHWTGPTSRARDCHSAAPPSPFSMRFNLDGEGVSAK